MLAAGVIAEAFVCVLVLWVNHHGGGWGLIRGPPALSVAVSL